MASPGKKFKEEVANNKPLQVVGVVNAYSAILAKNSGFSSVYLSGGGVAACSLGIPDLGITTLNDVLIDATRITDVCDLPLMVDIDTGWGGAFNITRAVKALEKAGVAAVHIEDQVGQKRCGHRPNKEMVSIQEMADRIKASVDARINEDFVIMARTDALANEGLDAAIERAGACVEAGADMIFPEAVNTLEQYAKFAEACQVPILANITEFGQTPMFTRDQLGSVGVSLILYPLSAFRAQSKAALSVYSAILNDGTQQGVLNEMQTREELYEQINYHSYEKKLDNLFKQK